MGNPIAIQLLTGTSPTWDALYKFAKITASGNVAITISGAGTPDGGVLHFVQGGAGGYTLSINGVAISVNATGLTRVDWAYDGERYSFGTNVSGGAQSSITPAAPTAGTVNDTDGIDTFTFTLSTGYAASDHEYQINGGSWTACASNVISVGNIAVAIGALLVRVKAATGRNASPALANEQAFTVTNITPDAPTGGTVDDSANTFTFTLNPSYAASEHEYNLNGAGYVACSSNVISVGNVAVAIGDLLVRVKAATGRNASATLANATAFTVGSTYTPTYAPAYVSALTAAGETVPAGHQTAFNSFEEALYNAGILTKFKQILLYYGSGINGVQKDFMGLKDCAIMGSPTFSGGVVLNGSSQYVNSNLTPSTDLSLNNFSFHHKMKNNTAPSNGVSGAYTAPGGPEVCMLQFGFNYNGSNSSFVFGSDGSVLSIANPAAWNGLWSLTRRSSTDAEGYIDGASVGTNGVTPAVGLPTIPLYYGCRNVVGAPENFINNTLEFTAVADSMTDAEVSALNTAIVNLWSAIGR